MDTSALPRTFLDWHQARRAQGMPTLGVLVGPPGLGAREWRRWADGHGRSVAQVSDVAAAAQEWVTECCTKGDLVDRALDWLAAATSRPTRADRLDPAAMTRYDLDQMWHGLSVCSTDVVAVAAYALLTAAVDGRRCQPAEFVRAVSSGNQSRVFAAGCGLYPEARWPTLLVVPTATAEVVAWFEHALRELEAIAVATPRLPVGVCVPATAFDAVVRKVGVSRTSVLAREGRISVPEATAQELGESLRAAGVIHPPPDETVRRLTADGLSPEVAAAFVSAVKVVRDPTPADEASDFRSVHESFLFGQLESLPETAGLFRPNVAVDFRHGPRMAEADLLADRLKIVVEVDGGRFHLNPEQYRRDRRKDWLYQRHGYLVLRFLAEDVVDDLEAILNAILDAVALRRHMSPEVPTRE